MVKTSYMRSIQSYHVTKCTHWTIIGERQVVQPLSFRGFYTFLCQGLFAEQLSQNRYAQRERSRYWERVYLLKVSDMCVHKTIKLGAQIETVNYRTGTERWLSGKADLSAPQRVEYSKKGGARDNLLSSQSSHRSKQPNQASRKPPSQRKVDVQRLSRQTFPSSAKRKYPLPIKKSLNLRAGNQAVLSKAARESKGTVYKRGYTLFKRPNSPENAVYGGCALRRAIVKVQPCIDLRRVRRGRKLLEIPRILPFSKRRLFGVRQLLKIMASSRQQSAHSSLPIRSGDKYSADKRKLSTTNVQSSVSSQTLHSIHSIKKEYISSPATCPLTSRTKHYQTRIAQSTRDSKRSSLSLPDSQNSVVRALSNEIKASSGSRSRAIDNKKRVYRRAFANRGLIRMAWWL